MATDKREGDEDKRHDGEPESEAGRPARVLRGLFDEGDQQSRRTDENKHGGDADGDPFAPRRGRLTTGQPPIDAAGLAQPFTPPAVRPLTKKRCSAKNTTIGSTIDTNAADVSKWNC